MGLGKSLPLSGHASSLIKYGAGLENRKNPVLSDCDHPVWLHVELTALHLLVCKEKQF